MWLSVPWSAGLPAVVPPEAAGTGVVAAREHRVAVIVDTGSQVKSVCVRFREESISGVEALNRAQLDPVFQAFSGKGAAVCALCGVGCPTGESCLTCNAEGRFWAYSRAPAGTASLRTSGVGASSTTVRDGDVEGWRWALGGTPPFAPVEQVCGEVVPGAPPTTATPPPPSTGSAVTTTPAGGSATTPPAVNRGTATETGPTGFPSTVVPDTRASPSTTLPSRSGAVAGARRAPSTPVTRTDAARDGAPDGGGAGGWSGLAGFATLLGGLVGWAAWARRTRRRGAHAG